MSVGHDKLTPDGKKFFAEIERLKRLQVRVGYERGKTVYDDKSKEVDVTDVAMFNELGTSSSPSRPFLRKSVDENESRIKNACSTQLKKIAQGGTSGACLKEIGAFGVKIVQEKIRDGEYVPDAPATVRKKGSDKPLIDTGLMRQSVHYVIKPKGED